MTAAVKLAQALTKFDANRDQTLTEAQLVAILCRPGGVKPMAETEARSWFRRLSGGADRVPMTTLVATWSGAATGTLVSSANRNLPPARVRHLFKKVPFGPPIMLHASPCTTVTARRSLTRTAMAASRWRSSIPASKGSLTGRSHHMRRRCVASRRDPVPRNLLVSSNLNVLVTPRPPGDRDAIRKARGGRGG